MMEQKERRALDKCFESLLRDLDPSPSFLHSLYADNVLTEEQMDKISKIASRETQVAMLVRFLPHRGPNAFSIFRDKLSKDYPWIAQKLADELRRLQSGQESINKRLLNVVRQQLVPLVYANNALAEVCDEKSHPAVIIQTLSDLVTNLELKCYKALGYKAAKGDKSPIHKLIEDRVKVEKKRVETVDDIRKQDSDHNSSNTDELSKEVRDLKKQLREAAKLKAENERLKTLNVKQKEKLKDFARMSRDVKRYKQETEKFKRETEMLRYEVATLRDQLRGNITELFS